MARPGLLRRIYAAHHVHDWVQVPVGDPDAMLYGWLCAACGQAATVWPVGQN